MAAACCSAVLVVPGAQRLGAPAGGRRRRCPQQGGAARGAGLCGSTAARRSAFSRGGAQQRWRRGGFGISAWLPGSCLSLSHRGSSACSHGRPLHCQSRCRSVNSAGSRCSRRACSTLLLGSPLWASCRLCSGGRSRLSLGCKQPGCNRAAHGHTTSQCVRGRGPPEPQSATWHAQDVRNNRNSAL